MGRRLYRCKATEPDAIFSFQMRQNPACYLQWLHKPGSDPSDRRGARRMSRPGSVYSCTVLTGGFGPVLIQAYCQRSNASRRD